MVTDEAKIKNAKKGNCMILVTSKKPLGDSFGDILVTRFLAILCRKWQMYECKEKNQHYLYI